MITNRTTITYLVPTRSALRKAIELYQKWNGQVDFWSDFADYLATGVVISTQESFLMAKVIQLGSVAGTDGSGDGANAGYGTGANGAGYSRNGDGGHAWFVRVAVGRLDQLAALMPFYLPRIAFCRRNDGRVRVVDTDRFMRRVVKGGD